MPRLATKRDRERSKKRRGQCKEEKREGVGRGKEESRDKGGHGEKEWEKRKNHHQLKRGVTKWVGEPNQGWRKKRSHTANRTVCPGWQQAKCWRVSEICRSYGRPGCEGLAGGANTGGGAIPLP